MNLRCISASGLALVMCASLAAQPAGNAAAQDAARAEGEPQSEKKTVTQQLLDLMRRLEHIDAEEYDRLSAEAAAEAAALEAARADAQPSDWDFKWDNGFRLNSADGQFALKFGGRIQLDAAAVGMDSDVRRALSADRGFGTEFRRSRLYVSGTFYKYGIFKAQYDFASSDPAEFKDVYMGLTDLPCVGTVRVGHFKEPFSLEELTSSNDITFLERSLASVFNQARNTGVAFDGPLLEQRMYYGVGAFFRTDDFGNDFTHNSNYAVTARLAGLPWYEDDGRQLLHVGAAYSRQFVDEFRFSQRPEAHLAPRFVDTGTFASNSADLVNTGVAMVCGPLSLQGEFTGAWPEVHAAEDVFFWGAYGQISYFLTGEHRVYDRERAIFSRVTPIHPFDLETGHCGALELTARYSHLALDDEEIRGGTLNDITAGLNWYLFKSSRVMFNYVYSRLNGVGDANIFETRFQVTF